MESNQFFSSEAKSYISRINEEWNSGVQIVASAAAQQGIEVSWINKNSALINLAEKPFIQYRYFGTESIVASRLYGDKIYTKAQWDKAGIRTPKGRLASSAEDAFEFMLQLGRPVVLKPRSSYASKGVSVNLSTFEEIHSAYELAQRFHNEVIVEEFLLIKSEYRCLVTSDELIAVMERLPSYVVGDGKSTIGELIVHKNIKRLKVPSTYSYPVRVDQKLEQYLARDGLLLSTVPPAGNKVTLNPMRILSTGGDQHNRTSELKEHIEALAIRAIKAIPCPAWAGLDLIEDANGKFYAIEINSNAQTNGMVYPTYGPSVDIGSKLLDSYRDNALKVTERVSSGLNKDLGFEKGEAGGSARRLDSYFKEWLELNNWTVDPLHSNVHIAAHSNGDTFAYSELFTSADSASVVNFASSHGLVRAALARQEIPRVKARRFREKSLLSEYCSAQAGPISVQSFTKSWAGTEATIRWTDRGKSLENLPVARFGYLAQAVLPGKRVKICLSQTHVFTVFGEESLTGSQLDSVSQLAMRAISVIPNLRWACVDIVLPEVGTSSSFGRVEGLSMNPTLGPKMQVLEGNLSALFRFIITNKDI